MLKSVIFGEYFLSIMEKTFVPQDFLPVVLQLFVALGFVVSVMIVTHIIGGKRRRVRSIRKEENFECGIEVKGNARFPFSVKYFLIAILFVLFDVEVIFFYPWAINFKGFGWAGFAEMMLFIAFFLVGFYYVLKKGALDWNN
jgi:NADH-quinone oxidoreductase subunit A